MKKSKKKYLEEYVEHFHHNCLLAGEPELLPWVEIFFAMLFEAGVGYLILRFGFSEYAHDIVYISGFLFLAAMITRKKGFTWFLYRSFLYSAIFAMIMAAGYCLMRSDADDSYISTGTECIILVMSVVFMTILSAVITYRRMFICCRKEPYKASEQAVEFITPGGGVYLARCLDKIESKLLNSLMFLIVTLAFAIIVFEVVPFIMVYVFSKKYDLDAELIEKNKRLREEDKKEKERKRVEEEGLFKF